MNPQQQRRIAYFTMEIALQDDVPTYCGGLGVLAGDTIRAAADLSVPIVAVTLLHRKGYFRQSFDDVGQQHADPVDWPIEQHLTDTNARAHVTIEGRRVTLRAWQYTVHGSTGSDVSVYLLDADLPENAEQDRRLTDHLYGGDHRYRLCQEVILGLGGYRMLRALGHNAIDRFHMNEGHASLLTIAMLAEQVAHHNRDFITDADIDFVRQRCVFTTHTPVPAGHDQFGLDLVYEVLGASAALAKHELLGGNGVLHMTMLAMNLSHYVNGVARRHGEVSRHLFPGYAIDHVTNGVHANTWVSPPFARLFDAHMPQWRTDSAELRHALLIGQRDIWDAHRAIKGQLIDRVNAMTGIGMNQHAFTIGFARRATPYKRADLLLSDPDRLRRIAREIGPLQIIYGGKAHPGDGAGKEIIRRIHEIAQALRDTVTIVYLPNYEMELARLIVPGVDLWLNTPNPPQEASGTSGMKAAMNGVPSLSVLDGWWVEGCIEGVTGWAIGEDRGELDAGKDHSRDQAAMYDKLEHIVMPMYYNDRQRWIEIMRHAIAINGPQFSTHRMVREYVTKAYIA